MKQFFSKATLYHPAPALRLTINHHQSVHRQFRLFQFDPQPLFYSNGSAMKRAKTSIAGLTMLGSSEISFPKSPQVAKLETFPNKYHKRDYWIHVACPDFTSLCPVTGQPDFAEIAIDYIPGDHCLETKSLKFYLASYRNVHSFNEEVVNRILDDLVKACHPRRIMVLGKFAARGGLALTVSAEYPDPSPLQGGPK